MLSRKLEVLYLFLIAFISIFLVFDLFINTGQPATFDGTTHITTIAQFFRGMSDGEIRVTWADGFANYGMPIPLISQQVTPTLASLINFVVHNVLLSFNIVFLIGALLSAVFYYIFLRIYFKPEIALAGTFLFNFAPYRIINTYIRGAQPEFFSGVFVPLILIGIYLTVKKQNPYGLLMTIFSVFFLILTHPFMFVTASILFIPYLVFCLYGIKGYAKPILRVLLAMIIGIGISAFYTLPLVSEVKYFNYGVNYDPFVPNQFLKLSNFLDPNWYYFYKNDTYVRGNFIKVDILESAITALGVLLLFYYLIKKKKDYLLLFSVLTSLMLIFLTISPSLFVYENFKLLRNIQFPWRMLSSLIFITPIILCIILQKIKYQKVAVIFIITLIAFLRFPQVYGKNYTQVAQNKYFFTTENLHGNILNTVWTGKTSEYPIKSKKAEIITGQGNIKTISIKNASRKYQTDGKTDLRMVDNTFYFPGWKVYIDGKSTPIQFQDPQFRGIITYEVPKGNHSIELKFENTRPRIAGYALSIIFLFLAVTLFIAIKTNKIKFFYSAAPKALRK